MKNLRYLFGMACITLVLSSCATTMVVRTRPAPPVIIRPVPPQPGWVWISGEWIWQGGGYVFRQGYWVSPRRGYVWQPGRWQRFHQGWKWRGGHWRRI